MEFTLTLDHKEHRTNIRTRFFKAQAQVENKLLEMGLCLLEAQENPHLYPEFVKPGGGINMQKLLREEFGIRSSTAYRYMDFAILRQKLSHRGKQFPETAKQAEILAPYKDEDSTLEAIMERAKEVTNGTLKLSAPELNDVVHNVVEKGSPDLPEPEPQPKSKPRETDDERRQREIDEEYERAEREREAEFKRTQEDIENARKASEKTWERLYEHLGSILGNKTMDLNEREAELGRLIVEAGYRAISKKAHPDAGGSHEDMVALNNVKNKLLSAVQ